MQSVIQMTLKKLRQNSLKTEEREKKQKHLITILEHKYKLKFDHTSTGSGSFKNFLKKSFFEVWHISTHFASSSSCGLFAKPIICSTSVMG